MMGAKQKTVIIKHSVNVQQWIYNFILNKAHMGDNEEEDRVRGRLPGSLPRFDHVPRFE